MRYQLPYLLARVGSYYSVVAGALGIAFCLINLNPLALLMAGLLYYGISCRKFIRHTKEATMDFYMYYQLDRSVPKLKHSAARNLKGKCIRLGIASILIMLQPILFSILLITDHTPYSVSVIFYMLSFIFLVLYGSQVVYCRMVYRSLR